MDLWTALGMVVIGSAAGLLGGLLGVGGSIVMIPAMTELIGPQQHLYQAAAMIVNFFVVTPAVYQHLRAGAVRFEVVRWIVPAGMVSVVAGVMVSECSVFAGSGQRYLTGIFGLFLFYVTGCQIWKMFAPSGRPDALGESDVRLSPVRIGLLVGIPTGFAAGLLGIGGGIVAVPLQVRLLKMPLRNAIANSAAGIIGISALGSVVKNYALATRDEAALTQSLALAGILIPAAMIGSYVGSRLTHTLPLRAVQVAFFLLMLTAAIRMSTRALG